MTLVIQFDAARYDLYSSIPVIIEPLAHSMGITLSDEAMRLQRLAACSIALVDDMWDQNASRYAILSFCQSLANQEIVEPPPSLHPRLIDDLTGLYAAITPEQGRQFFNSGVEATRLSSRYATCTSLREYIKLLMQEGACASSMITGVVPEAEQRHPAFAKYARLAARIVGVGNVIDSAADITKDYHDGLVQILPTSLIRIGFFALAAHEGIKCTARLNFKAWTNLSLNGLAQIRRIRAAEKTRKLAANTGQEA